MAPESVRDDLPAAAAVVKTGFPATLHPLARLAIVVTAAVAESAENCGVTPMQARLLGALRERPQRMAQLALSLGVERAAMTGLVDRAVSHGLVTRCTVVGDRRLVEICATPAGSAASERFYAELSTHLDALLESLPVSERGAFRAGVETILDGAESILGG